MKCKRSDIPVFTFSACYILIQKQWNLGRGIQNPQRDFHHHRSNPHREASICSIRHLRRSKLLHSSTRLPLIESMLQLLPPSRDKIDPPSLHFVRWHDPIILQFYRRSSRFTPPRLHRSSNVIDFYFFIRASPLRYRFDIRFSNFPTIPPRA